MDEVRKFMEALKNDPRAKELMNSTEIPVDDKKVPDVYLDLAKKLGFSFSREDFLIWVQENEKKCRARAEKAKASMEEALDPEAMSKVAGGKGNKYCESSFNQSEWCWLSDSCKVAVNIYELPESD